jgi:hypothetical protein
MPFIDGTFFKPEQAIMLGKCPECGRDLKDSNFQVETMLHWPRGLDPNVISAEAFERVKMLEEYFSLRS